MKIPIFDCFGVLILSPQEYFESLANDLDIKKQVQDLFFQKLFGIISDNNFTDEISSLFNISTSKVEKIMKNQYNRNDFLLDFIRKNRSIGSKVVILSNVAQYFFDQLFTKQEQDELFDVIVLSEEVKFRKPDPRAFEMVFEKFNLKPNDFVMIDDLEENIIGAENVGATGILFTSNSDFEKSWRKMEVENA